MSKKTFKIVNGDLSDGYHTFDELYEHRCLLFLSFLRVFCAANLDNYKEVYWVRDHFDGWDLVVCYLKGKQISYHLPIKLRNITRHFQERHKDSHIWDGHNSSDIIKRLTTYLEESPNAPEA